MRVLDALLAGGGIGVAAIEDDRLRFAGAAQDLLADEDGSGADLVGGEGAGSRRGADRDDRADVAPAARLQPAGPAVRQEARGGSDVRAEGLDDGPLR
jgi:hypothetical protein